MTKLMDGKRQTHKHNMSSSIYTYKSMSNLIFISLKDKNGASGSCQGQEEFAKTDNEVSNYPLKLEFFLANRIP